jgi:transposase-like protein
MVSIEEARQDLAAWLAKTQSSSVGPRRRSKRTLTFYRLPRQPHRHLKSTNNEEIKRRTHLVRIFPGL